MLRTFIAVDFPPEIVSKIAKIIQYFKTQTPEKALKWVPPENLHLTIKFLGDIPENKLDQVKRILTESVAGRLPFNIEIEGLGMFPNKNKPRAVWLGINCDHTLSDIHQSLDQNLKAVGIDPEQRRFSPHLTIARVRRDIQTDARQAIGHTLAQFKVDSLGVAAINEIILYQSELTRSGSIYTPLFSQTLNQV